MRGFEFFKKLKKSLWRHNEDEGNLLFYWPSHEASVAAISDGYTPSDDFVARLVKSYRFSVGSFREDEQDIWRYIDERRRNIHEKLIRNDRDLGRFLANPRDNELFYGMDELCSSLKPRFTSSDIVDRILRLGEAVGARRSWSPENLPLSRLREKGPSEANLNDELDKISKAIGVDLQFKPVFADSRGVKSDRGIVEIRALDAVYQAHRIRQLGGNIALEIGGGVGRTAYFALQFGASQYSIVDIPLSLIGQALYLAGALGEDSVQLDGESNANAKILLFSPANFPSAAFDVALNADSFPEILPDQVRKYLKNISEQARILISINHELSELRVYDEFHTLAERFPYWMRKGYVEEVVRFQRPA